MPVTLEDVRRILGPNSIVDYGSVLDEVQRRMPLGGEELTGIRKDMTIQKVARDIIEQPQLSGQQKWEDRYLYGKSLDAPKEEIRSWMERSTRALSIAPNEYRQFFTWLKSFENSPWQIENVDDVYKTVKVYDAKKGLMFDMPYESAMGYLRKGLGWSDADVYEYWDWKKSMYGEDIQAMLNEVITPEGYKFVYSPSNEPEGCVIVSKAVLSNKSWVQEDLRGREVTVVVHHHQNGSEVELGTFWGPDAAQRAYGMAKSFAAKMTPMSKCSGSKLKKMKKAQDEGDEKEVSIEPKIKLKMEKGVTPSLNDLYGMNKALPGAVPGVREPGSVPGPKPPKPAMPRGARI